MQQQQQQQRSKHNSRLCGKLSHDQYNLYHILFLLENRLRSLQQIRHFSLSLTRPLSSIWAAFFCISFPWPKYDLKQFLFLLISMIYAFWIFFPFIMCLLCFSFSAASPGTIFKINDQNAVKYWSSFDMEDFVRQNSP